MAKKAKKKTKKAAKSAAKKVSKKAAKKTAKKTAQKTTKKAAKKATTKAPAKAAPKPPPPKVGSQAWCELHTTTPDVIVPFYTQLFGWKTRVMDMPGMGAYTMLQVPGEKNEFGGVLKNDHGPVQWLQYFFVKNVDQSAARAREMGASILMPPTDIPGGMGRFSILQDPAGASFAVFQGS